ncbi:putative methyltransferase PMT26 [Apium graveolens]|uniref:putative methyltransferase PMT26 n=1 Tax=Apium graveolens TaxID=4045 RepID=UPI003D7AFB23
MSYTWAQIWYHNVPYTQLAEYKGHQNWVKISGEYLLFPGGGTQMMQGALPYIYTIQKVEARKVELRNSALELPVLLKAGAPDQGITP